MKKYNKLELIGFILLLLGALSWTLERVFEDESLNSLFDFGRIFFWIGLAIWAFGYMQKEQAAKNKSAEE